MTMRNRIQALATTIAIQPTLEVVQLMGHSEIIGFVHDKGRHLEVHPVSISATGDVALGAPELYYHSALYGRRSPTDEELAALRAPLDDGAVVRRLRECLFEFNGTPDQLRAFVSFLKWCPHAELHAFWDDPTSALPFWDTNSDKWKDESLDPDIPF